MQWLLLWIAVLGLHVVSSFCEDESPKYTYWVDKSCTNRPDWEEYLKEALNMAKRANERLLSETDTDFANVFERIFNTKKTDEDAKLTVSVVMSGIVERWSPTDDQVNSDHRFYCDNDLRWQIWRDSERKARRHTDGKVLYKDIKNVMMTTDVACRDGETPAVTYLQAAKVKGDPHKVGRRVTTFCDLMFSPPAGLPAKLSDLKTDQDLRDLKDGIRDLRFLASHAIIHEWTHSRAFNRIDVDEENSYGWNRIIGYAKDKALKNADNYAIFAVWAGLADRGDKPGSGFTLSRYPEDTKSNAWKVARADGLKGLLKVYPDITKRWLTDVVAKRFRA